MTHDEAVGGIGELVVGNELADKYWITRAGTIWKLIDVSDEDEETIKIIRENDGGMVFNVDIKCFDFVNKQYRNYNSRGRSHNY
jgi:hypothetical protein